ncbi:hypothetical protein A5724_29590 [Mycobacterium sp. ACS1612]|uniref:hypothetical protein n=1 Tax=Mycobacterium sp. ACS1612 TaxID=1834117 RepID=UPI0007FBCADB|nr:hypothetical protein [Mycobacterium sp. ACS1612]OBF27763.1 hypothetical protein A5724_29590 [Mycobacterium sp. ACS1612]
MHVWIPAFAAGAATVAAVACGVAQESAPTVATKASKPSSVAVAAPIAAPAAMPNADGDPQCPIADAWGSNPFGTGIVVTHWSDDTAPVTVLVRTKAGSDRSQRALLTPGELRLFEFPDVDQAAVGEVLVMTNTRRCYVSADPAALR